MMGVIVVGVVAFLLTENAGITIICMIIWVLLGGMIFHD